MWLVIYLRSYLVKYGELKQSLDMADKEREIDLKEREALVYRADSLQREFEHINKLLQVLLRPGGITFYSNLSLNLLIQKLESRIDLLFLPQIDKIKFLNVFKSFDRRMSRNRSRKNC